MSPRTTNPSTATGLRRALRRLHGRVGRAVAAVTDGVAGLLAPGAPRQEPVLVPVPVRSTDRLRRR